MKRFRFMWLFVGLLILLFSLSSIWAAENTISNVTFHINNSDEEVERVLSVFRNIDFFEKNKFDPYLLQPDSWERLPDYVAEYAKTVK